VVLQLDRHLRDLAVVRKIVELTRMANPPQVFVGGSDGLAMVTPAIEARLKDMREHDALSRSTDIDA
jgi:hypothetical protein